MPNPVQSQRPDPERRSRLASRFASAVGLALLLAVALAALNQWTSVPVSAATLESQSGPGVLTLTDGRTLEGDITERADEVTINANGIVTTVPRSQVAAIEYGTPEARLRRQLEGLGPDDADARLDVADEAVRRGLLDLAQEITLDVRDRNPANERAAAMLDQIEHQRQMQRARGQGVRRAAREAVGRALRPTTENVLNEEQINQIRQAELQESDALAGRGRPRISFQDGVLKRFVESQRNMDFRVFNRADDITKALVILRESRDPDMLEDVRIASHPTSILEYLNRVQPIILNGCATSECHGGAAARSFALYGDAREDAASYTNFYLLMNTSARVPKGAGGAFDGVPAAETQPATDTGPLGRLVDRIQPDDSLLLNYMLPRDKARFPHPAVKNYDGVVIGTDQQNYQIVRRWIAESLNRLPGRGYGFSFRLEVPTTQPATQPAEIPDAPAGG